MSIWYSGIEHRKLNDAATKAKHLAFSGHQGVEHQGRETVQTLSMVLNGFHLISRKSLLLHAVSDSPCNSVGIP